MRHAHLFIVLTLCGCPSAQQGAVGAAGATGAPGPIGPRGPSGICDNSTCPALTSVDGLSGGALSGTTTLETANVTTVLNANRVVITKGAKQTSVNGFYCGHTAVKVDGTAFKTGAVGGNADQFGPWVAKKLCQEACANSPTAHMCTVLELMIAQDLRGGSDLQGAASTEPDNPAVAMPPLDPVPADNAFDVGWVRSLDGAASCKGLTSVADNGTIFRPSGDHGSFDSVSCAEQHPLYCCD